jgi:hypothetical protein
MGMLVYQEQEPLVMFLQFHHLKVTVAEGDLLHQVMEILLLAVVVGEQELQELLVFLVLLVLVALEQLQQFLGHH